MHAGAYGESLAFSGFRERHAPVDTPGYQPKSQAEDGPVARDAADVRRRAHVVFDGGPGQAESHSASGKKDSNYTPHGSDRSR